jgi:ssDNA-binding Zn-finger/Zn-ribbon topoisomerase 1
MLIRSKERWTETGWQNKVASVKQDGQSKVILNDQRQQFQPIAAKFRNRSRIFIAFILTGVFLFIIASFFGFSKSGWFDGFFVVCILSALITAFFFFPKLRCPVCSSDAARYPDFYCPECGGSRLSQGWLFSKKCADCGKSLRNGRRRNYRIHYCTNCGAYLDKRGL